MAFRPSFDIRDTEEIGKVVKDLRFPRGVDESHRFYNITVVLTRVLKKRMYLVQPYLRVRFSTV
jgi:hypothetical protein